MLHWRLLLFCLLLCTSLLYGARIYVAPNGLNTGSGNNWANAVTLERAIEISQNGDVVWMKRGTYLPQSTISLSYSQDNLSIYGGFLGNETALDQRDYDTNPTIIDGQGSVQLFKINSDDFILDGVTLQNGFIQSLISEGPEPQNTGGGAMHARGDNLILRNVKFINNTSNSERGAGAIFIWSVWGPALIENCLFEGNELAFNGEDGNGGGAIHNWTSDVTIRNSVFRNNQANKPGGAIFTWGNNFVIENSKFINNSTTDNGGAIYINSQNLKIKNTLFKGNNSPLGGAIYSGRELDITNSTFVDNQNIAIVYTSFDMGGTKLYNNIFYDNQSNLAQGYKDVDNRAFNPNANHSIDFRRNIFQENTYQANNLVGVNPVFVNYATGNYRLQASSPAIEYGRNNLYNVVSNTPIGSDSDLANNPRLYGTYVDAGAYEFQGAPVPALGCTQLSSPANNATNVALDANLTWSAVSGATGYYLSIGTTPGGTDILNQENVGNVTTYNPPANFNLSTTYYVTVTPFNAEGSATSCPETSFTTRGPNAPACTQLSSPANNATNVALDANLTWSASSGATGYYLSIGTTPGGTDILNQENVGNITTYNPPANFNLSTTYYVTVTPFNAEGSATSCPETSFTTRGPNVPSCTQLSSPANNATNVALDANLTWSAVSGATGYYLSIGTTPGGTDILNQENVGNVTTYNPPANFNLSTTYYVTVTPFNAEGSATSCPETSFTTRGPNVPSCTQLSSPANNATNVALDANLTWSAVSGATGYYLSIGTTPGGTDILNQENVGNVTTYNPPANFDLNTTYYVTVTPFNAEGSANSCPETSFTTRGPNAPACTQLSSPANNATNVALDANLTWSAVSGATGYYLSIGTTPGGTDILNQANVGNVTTYNPPTDFDLNTTYYVTITPFNAEGSANSCPETSFTTRGPNAPACTQLSSPANNATNVALDTNLTWSASSGATGYYLSIGTTPGGTDILNQANVGNVTTYNPPTDFDLNTTYYVTITPFNAEGSANSCPETSFTTRGLNAPYCTEMTLPTPNATDVSIGTNINWNLVTGATDYYVLITDENGITIYDALVGNVSTLDLTNDLAYSTTYTIQIIPQNAAGSAVDCSSFSFTTENAPLSAPTCTEMTLPTPNATDVSIGTNINWNLVTGATDYRVLITDENGATIYDALVGNVNTLNLTNDLAYSTTYTIQIIPQNAAGSAVDCSSFSFTTENAPLSAPTCTEMTLPTPNATDVSIGTNINWNLVTGATDYYVLITDENGITIYDALVGNVSTLDLTNDLAYSTTYTIQIIPQNAAGSAVDCSSFSFTTENAPLSAPTCTEMTLPTPNATDVSIGTNINWNLVTGATDYRVLITDENGATIYDALVGNVNTLDLTNDLAYSTTYTIQIIPQNAAGSAVDCSSFSFTTENAPLSAPTCTEMTLPTPNATDVSIATDFNWNLVTGATDYYVLITDENGITIYDALVGNVSTLDLTNDLAYSTTYTIQIIPQNAAGSAVDCSSFSFTTENAPLSAPTCTEMTLPTPNATDVSIGTNINWNLVTGATDYYVLITDENGITIYDALVGNVSTLDLTNDLAYSTTYTIQIIPQNAAGSAVDCSSFSFTTAGEPDSDGDGVVDSQDECPDTPVNVEVNENGCPICDLNLSVVTNNDQVQINVSGGTAPYTFILDQGNPTNSSIFNNLIHGSHHIKVISAEGCEIEQNFSVNLKYNFISPNGDGMNDVLDFSYLLDKTDPQLWIFNRFERLVFEGNESNQFIWNGMINGRTLPTTSYWYILKYKEPGSIDEIIESGWLMLKSK